MCLRSTYLSLHGLRGATSRSGLARVIGIDELSCSPLDRPLLIQETAAIDGFLAFMPARGVVSWVRSSLSIRLGLIAKVFRNAPRFLTNRQISRS
jgi:hypothetical protein